MTEADPRTAEPAVGMSAPADPYDPAWLIYNALHPNRLRSVGAAAAEGEGDGGDGGEGGEGGGEGGAGGGADGGDAGGEGADAGKDGKAKGEAGKEPKGEAKGGKGKEPKPPAADDWRAGIEDQKLRDFAGRFTTPAELAKAGFEFRQKLSNAITLPGKDATEEQIAEFHRKLGVPEKPEDFKIELPEELQKDERFAGVIGEFAKVAHKAGIPPTAAQAAVNWYLEAETKALEERQAAEQAATDAALDGLKKEWKGEEFDRNVEIGKRYIREFGDEDLIKFLEETKVGGIALGDHPAFLKLSARSGRAMMEDRPLLGMSDEDKSGMTEKFDQLTADAANALNRGDKETADRLYKERDKLAQQMYGTQPLVGAEGRAV